jgi:hypothetical protein
VTWAGCLLPGTLFFISLSDMLTESRISTPSILSFGRLPHSPVAHFKLYFYAAVLHILAHLEAPTRVDGDTRSPEEMLFEQFPFLEGYNEELATFGLSGLTIEEARTGWQAATEAWEQSAPRPLPISALSRATGLGYRALSLLVAVGLVEEDARFGALFSIIQRLPDQPRPTLTLLSAWWSDGDGYGEVRALLRRWQELGFLDVTNPESPRLDWVYQPNPVLWDALRGERTRHLTPWLRYQPLDQAPALDSLILPETFRHSLERIPALLDNHDVQTLVLRGPQHNGRHAVMAALARRCGFGTLETSGFAPRGEEHWHAIGSLATLLEAMPVVHFDLAPGETAELPVLKGYDGPLGIILGMQGGLLGPSAESALTLRLDLPDVHARRVLWQSSLGAEKISNSTLDTVSVGMRLTSGNIRRAAMLTRACAALEGREQVTQTDIQQASRSLNRQALETLAQHIEGEGSLADISLGNETRDELNGLLNRIRFRESLPGGLGPALRGQINPGVRALFSGPSGTGKTLAARLLAAELKMDLYRIDLSAVVNKYIGETEKNLNQVFARAEELDVVLLLDEGDALLTQRTTVNNSNDRYANLETNYLLQRIESFYGILIVTTNAAERIDNAFQRRMDVVVTFHMPDAAERWGIWQTHLPTGHTLDSNFLKEVVGRCALSGAQIRSVVLHAALLALQAGQTIDEAAVTQAIQREYRKVGAVSPLKAG